MGGAVPLGYKAEDRALLPNPEEIPKVQHLFERYVALGSVIALRTELREQGIVTRNGHDFDRGMLYHMLSNPIYIGKVRHKKVIHDGLHESIIHQELWDAVQAKLADNRNVPYARRQEKASYPLLGKLYDDVGVLLATNHAKKAGKRYCYYISRHLKGQKTHEGWRIPATTIEPLIASIVVKMLTDASAVQQACQDASIPHEQWQRIIRAAKEQGQRLAKPKASAEVFALVERAVLHTDSIVVTLDLTGIVQSRTRISLTHSTPMQMKRRGVEMRLVIPSADAMSSKPDHTLMRAIARAHYWFDELVSGRASTLKELAQQENIGPSYIGDALKLAFFAPDIVEKILAGQQPASLTTFHLLRRIDLPIAWDAQREALGF